MNAEACYEPSILDAGDSQGGAYLMGGGVWFVLQPRLHRSLREAQFSYSKVRITRSVQYRRARLASIGSGEVFLMRVFSRRNI